MSKNTKIFYTDNDNLTEVDFFLREFNAKLKKVNPHESGLHRQIMNSDLPCIASTNVAVWTAVLNSIPKQSVYFFLLGNETYDFQVYDHLSKFPSIKHAFIYALPNEGNWLNSIGGFFGELIDCDQLSSDDLLQSIRNARTGLLKKKQFRSIKFPFQSTPFPQGYSRAFALQVSRAVVEINNKSSLVNSKEVRAFFGHEKKFKIGFVGQSGSKRRSWVTNYAKTKTEGIFMFRENYGGNNANPDDSYISMLRTSYFSLVPPGAFNSHNHRYLESLISGGLPLIVANVATDTFKNQNWTQNLTLRQRYSYKHLIDFIAELSIQEINDLINRVNVSELNRIRTDIERIRGLLSSTNS